MQCEPIEREGRNRRGANGEWRSCAGVEEGFAGPRFEREGSGGDEG